MGKMELVFMEECEDCPELEVKQKTTCLTSLDGREICHHTLTCEHIRKCKRLKEYLQKGGK